MSLLTREPLEHISIAGRTGQKCKRKYEHDPEQVSTSNLKMYNPDDFEFTLIYFCDSTCRNSLRFAHILVTFIQICNNIETHLDKKPVQLICVPNDESSYPSRLYDGPFDNLSNFWHLGFNYHNRLPLIYLLSVTKVPTLIIVDNQTGNIVTDKGISVVESYDNRNYENLINSWRDGKSGLGYFGNIIAIVCVIS